DAFPSPAEAGDTHPRSGMVAYERHPERITAVFDAEPANTVKALFRKGSPKAHSRPSPTSDTTADGGWFGGAPAAPDLPLDTDVLSPQDHAELTESLKTNGFWGPTCYYLNHRANAAFAKAAVNGGRLGMPVLFVGAAYDPVADLTNPRALDRMRTTCARLTERRVQAGHWLQLEAAGDVNHHLATWLRTAVENPASGS
ncbi:alpha/beta hydrolase, partial [Streptomyces glomeratus]